MKDALTVLISAALVWGCLLGAAHAQRIAWTCDGNAHDRDDWPASAFAIALVGDANANSQLPHFDFDNHAPTSAAAWESQMRTSVWGAADRWRITGPVFWDNRPTRTGAVTALANRINESSGVNPLTVAIAGPCHTLYYALEKCDRSKLRYVTFLSHSSWNTQHKHNGSKNWADCNSRFGPLTLQTIPNQNDRLFTRKNGQHDWTPWYWLRDAPPGSNNRWLWDRMKASGKPDVSDSGMMYYLLYGKSTPTPADYRGRLE